MYTLQGSAALLSIDNAGSCWLGGKPHVCDYVHGSDGMGNLFLPPTLGQKFEKSAPEFLVDQVSKYPGEVSILALGPLTNLALVSITVMFYYLLLCL